MIWLLIEASFLPVAFLALTFNAAIVLLSDDILLLVLLTSSVSFATLVFSFETVLLVLEYFSSSLLAEL